MNTLTTEEKVSKTAEAARIIVEVTESIFNDSQAVENGEWIDVALRLHYVWKELADLQFTLMELDRAAFGDEDDE